jgi:hypothetical protein
LEGYDEATYESYRDMMAAVAPDAAVLDATRAQLQLLARDTV